MTRYNEPKFAFTARASDRPPPEHFHTAAEWEENIAALHRATTGNPNADLVTTTLDHDKIWARYNSKAGTIQSVIPAAEEE